jgi:hypothetical protein
MLDSSHAGTVPSNLYYYSIASDTRDTVTSVFVDGAGNPIPDLDSLVSGDMAFDGSGNLWMVCASKWNYALYEVKARVPTTPTAKLTAHIVIPRISNPAVAVGKVSFTGIAFNSAGNLFLTLGNGAAGNKSYELTNPSASGLTLIGAVPADFGGDLTSCSAPLVVLPLIWLNFTASFHDQLIGLNWKANENGNIARYEVRYSADGSQWQPIAQIGADNSGQGDGEAYSYELSQYHPGPIFTALSRFPFPERKVSPQ